MERRSFLATVLAGSVGATAGCIGGGRVELEINKSLTAINPEMGWWKKLPDVEGNGALDFLVRAERPFEVFYFPSEDAFSHYETYVKGGTPSKKPRGDRDISRVATEHDGKYVAEVPKDGSRKSIDTEGTHYFVVDHSNYGLVPVDQYGKNLDPFVNLKVIKEQSPI